jgi:hypothetical protein
VYLYLNYHTIFFLIQLKEYEAKDIEYNGIKMTEYEASQTQRGLERNIRKHKRTVAALEAVGQDASAARKKLREANKAYTDFTDQTGLRKQPARTKIAGVVGKNTQTPIVKQGNNGIIESSNKEVRKQYLEEVSKIKDKIDKTLPMEEQAKQAFEARNRIRNKARSQMADKKTKEMLEKENPNKTFEELVKDKMKR